MLTASFTFQSRPADTPGMEFLVALQYPNGRINETVYHDETVYHAALGMEPGTEFQMYRHRWRVVGLLEKPHRSHLPAAQPPRILCVPVADFLYATRLVARGDALCTSAAGQCDKCGATGTSNPCLGAANHLDAAVDEDRCNP